MQRKNMVWSHTPGVKVVRVKCFPSRNVATLQNLVVLSRTVWVYVGPKIWVGEQPCQACQPPKHAHHVDSLIDPSTSLPRGVYPPNTLEQVPPPLPTSPPFPSPPLEVGPLIAAKGSGGAL